MSIRRGLHEKNRLSWNHATRAHDAHKVDQAKFLREGGTTLFPEEIGLLGDLAGKRLLHLLCNSGQDTLSIARLGADVVGVDISDEAIDFARALSADSGIPARFERADAYDWLDAAVSEQFDVVYLSYGAICWLSALEPLANGIDRVLRPGGRLVMVEFHPFSMVFEADWSIAYPYLTDEPLEWSDGVSDYVGAADGALSPSGHVDTGEEFENPHAVTEFLWGVGEILTAVARAGLRIDHVAEYPYSNAATLFEGMVERGDRRMHPPAGKDGLPLMWSVVASKATAA